MNILLTGGSGLVGTGFKKISEEFDHSITYATSKDCDLTDYNQTNDFIKSINPDCVIHLAANVGGLYKNMNFKVDMFEKNITMNFNVLKCCHNNNVSKFVGMLSTCIFPDKTTYPINESMLHDGAPHCSNDAYAYAKRMLDIHCQAYNEQYFDTNYNCIIPTNIYGDNDNYNLEDAHVLPALIHKCYLAKKAGEPFETRGTGKPLRQFIHADDLARTILQLLPSLNQENVIVSPTEEYSIAQAATYVAQAFDYEHALTFNSNYSDGQFKKTADNSKLMSMLPETKFKPLVDGIRETVNYFQDNFPDRIRV